MLTDGVRRGIPVVIGTAGGSGARPHVDWCEAIIREIAAEEKLTFKMGIIYADIPKARVRRHLRKGEIVPLTCVPPLTEAVLDESVNIVAPDGRRAHPEGLGRGLPGRPGRALLRPGRFRGPADQPRLRPRPGPPHGQDPGVRGHRRDAGLGGRLRLRQALRPTPSSSRRSIRPAASPRCPRPPTPSTRSPTPTIFPAPAASST